MQTTEPQFGQEGETDVCCLEVCKAISSVAKLPPRSSEHVRYLLSGEQQVWGRRASRMPRKPEEGGLGRSVCLESCPPKSPRLTTCSGTWLGPREVAHTLPVRCSSCDSVILSEWNPQNIKHTHNQM